MSAKIDISKGIGGALIVGGTAIGAGMLALPVATAQGGFLPAVVMYILCWLFSCVTGLLFLEICIWMPRGANIVTMASSLLGPFGKVAAWLLYIFLFYTLTIAYVSGGGSFVSAILGSWVPQPVALILFTGVFAAFVYAGAGAVDKINLVLMLGLACAFLAFVAIGAQEVEIDRLQTMRWGSAIMALPILFTSFSYQGTLPTLYEYLGRNVKLVRFAIIVGTAIPLLTYIVWEVLILGVVPLEGPHGLRAALAMQSNAVEPLRHAFPNSHIFLIGQFFGAFALTTSFLGVTLGLFDFLVDGLSIEKTRVSKFWLSLAIFVPPVCITLVNPMIFLTALSYAGGIGCALLLGLLPALMVWRGRYYLHKENRNEQLPGGKIALVCIMLFVAFDLYVEFFCKLV